MKLGFIGLGRMGKAIVEHLLEQGVDVDLYNRTREKMDEFLKENQESRIKNQELLIPAYDYREFLKKIEVPRVIFMMVEHGKPVDEVIDNLVASGVSKSDIVIDGGNSFYKDSIRRYQRLKELGVNYLDIGTSGGIEGARQGACLMVGGDREVYEKVKPILEKICVKDGLSYSGPTGAGHFVKMVHNGVEYGMLQALGEGFEILSKGPYKLDYRMVAKNWSHGSVVRGWLTELLEKAFSQDAKLDGIEGVVGGVTTGKWTIETAREFGVETPVIYESLRARETSGVKPTFAGKIVAALRNQFGGHQMKKRNI